MSPMRGKILDVVTYDKVLTRRQMHQVFRYMGQRYGVRLPWYRRLLWWVLDQWDGVRGP